MRLANHRSQRRELVDEVHARHQRRPRLQRPDVVRLRHSIPHSPHTAQLVRVQRVPTHIDVCRRDRVHEVLVHGGGLRRHHALALCERRVLSLRLTPPPIPHLQLLAQREPVNDVRDVQRGGGAVKEPLSIMEGYTSRSCCSVRRSFAWLGIMNM